jgi:hypothetical protein
MSCTCEDCPFKKDFMDRLKKLNKEADEVIKLNKELQEEWDNMK